MLLIIPGAFGIFRRDAGRTIGLYDRDTIGEDFDLTVKLLKTGGKLTFVPTALAWTYCPNNWRAWIRQRVRWAHGQFSTLLKHKDIASIYTYRRKLVLAIYDMVFVDIGLLFLRMGGLIWLTLTYTESIFYVYTLLAILYIINESISILTAAALSPRRRDLKYVYLVPIVVFFYRPLSSYVRFYAYLKRLFGKDVEW
jgi:cellulose synthase/poly-beta-1,6-N-acetylglucosamine synthase-like glycosyltransferase